jgi:pyruvate formate lyase activating enzyme
MLTSEPPLFVGSSSGVKRLAGQRLGSIEEASLAHFHPGSKTLFVDVAGRDEPREIAATARRLGCANVAFACEDPELFAERAVDIARACRAGGVRAVAMTSGAVAAAVPLEPFGALHAAHVALDAFDGQALETVQHILAHTGCWVELESRLVPGLNDTDPAIASLCERLLERLGPDVPLCFSAHHRDHALRGSAATLRRARSVAQGLGVHHVYTAPVGEDESSRTICAGCGTVLVERRGLRMIRAVVEGGICPKCKLAVPGRY